jgi:predicted nuclease of predicted toxin-antitoxin system
MATVDLFDRITVVSLLLDQGLAPLAATDFVNTGRGRSCLRDRMERAEDTEVLERAGNEGRVCITLDHDFHAH